MVSVALVQGRSGEPSRPSAQATLPHECAGRIARTLGIQASRVDSSSAMYCRSRRAESLRIASGSRRRRPGLPPTRPRAFAARRPALVRSRMSARSNSAAAPRTWRANLPCGVEVSIGSRSDLKCPPTASTRSITSSRWTSERASRSIRATTRMSPRPTRPTARASSGRARLAPDAFSSKTTWQPAARRSSSWLKVAWSSVETRA